MGGRGTASSGGNGKLSAIEEDAVFTYTTSRYQKINTSLREGTKLSKGDQKITEAMDSAIDKSSLAAGTTLYRGTSLDALGISGEVRHMSAKDVKALTGSKMSDKAFMSTSTSEKAANIFAGRSGMGDVKVVVTVASKGAKGLNVGENSNFGGKESEVILPRGATLKITGAKKYLSTLTIYAEY